MSRNILLNDMMRVDQGRAAADRSPFSDPETRTREALGVWGACGVDGASASCEPGHMLFMVIERFRDNDMVPVYRRVRDQGRKLPAGLRYVDSWVEPNFSRCFQLMECDDLRLLQQWVLERRGTGITFEFVPVVGSKETQETVRPYLDEP